MAVLDIRTAIVAGNNLVSKAVSLRSLFLLYVLLYRQPLLIPAQGLTEHQIQAGFLFNFTKFVEWPPEVYGAASDPIVLGIVGDNPFGSLLTEIAAGKSINGRGVVIRQFKEGQDLRSCQILFVGSTDRKHVEQILDALKGATVLTVGEGSEFALRGGVIAFFVEEKKVRLEIDLAAASQAHLKISAKLIAVARVVTPEARGKN